MIRIRHGQFTEIQVNQGFQEISLKPTRFFPSNICIYDGLKVDEKTCWSDQNRTLWQSNKVLPFPHLLLHTASELALKGSCTFPLLTRNTNWADLFLIKNNNAFESKGSFIHHSF